MDKKMGDLGDGKTDTLDERMWGDDEDDDDDDPEGSDKEEESGAGMDQVMLSASGNRGPASLAIATTKAFQTFSLAKQQGFPSFQWAILINVFQKPL